MKKEETQSEATPLTAVEMQRGVSCAVMVREYLEKNGYDGLVEYDGECGCSLDDLMPCGHESAIDCEAGHKIDCPDTCGEGCDFHIVSGKRQTESS